MSIMILFKSKRYSTARNEMKGQWIKPELKAIRGEKGQIGYPGHGSLTSEASFIPPMPSVMSEASFIPPMPPVRPEASFVPPMPVYP
jgi:hypothetical protein